MVFWFSIGAVALLLVIGIIQAIRHWDYGDYIWGWFASAGLLAVIMLIVIGAGSTTPPGLHAEMQKRYTLHTLVTKDSTSSELSGSFFLGFGGVQGSTSTSTKIIYIRTNKDGGSTIHDTTVGRSVIYEDAGDGTAPYMEDWVTGAWTNTVWVPWTWHYVVPGEAQHRFHIPKGSILSNYSVNP